MKELEELRVLLQKLGILYYKASFEVDTFWNNSFYLTIYDDNSKDRDMVFHADGTIEDIKRELNIYLLKNQTLTPQF